PIRAGLSRGGTRGRRDAIHPALMTLDGTAGLALTTLDWRYYRPNLTSVLPGVSSRPVPA
ncbi:hypothetical protein, partial [Natrinema soli]